MTKAQCRESPECHGVLVVTRSKTDRIFECQSECVNGVFWCSKKLREKPPGSWKVPAKSYYLKGKPVGSLGVEAEEQRANIFIHVILGNHARRPTGCYAKEGGGSTYVSQMLSVDLDLPHVQRLPGAWLHSCDRRITEADGLGQRNPLPGFHSSCADRRPAGCTEI